MRRRAGFITASLVTHLLLVQALRPPRVETVARTIIELEQLTPPSAPRTERARPRPRAAASPTPTPAPRPRPAAGARRAAPPAADPRAAGSLLSMRSEPPAPRRTPDPARDENEGPLYNADPDERSDARYPLRRDGRGNLVYEDTTFVARIAPDGTLRFADRANVRHSCGPAFSFDLNDAVLRARGEDPYRYEKRRFARATAALRARLRRLHRAARFERALAALPKRLQRSARRYLRQPARLRRLLFALWDECEERRDTADRRAIAGAGEAARAQIIAFIRRALPCSTPGSFGRAELTQLNRRRTSRQRFAPCDAR